MNEFAVSSFSLRSVMGPVSFRGFDADGSEHSVTLDAPSTIDLAEFAALAAERFGVGLIEICQVQLDDHSPQALERIALGMAVGGVTLLTMPIDVGDLAHPLADVRAWSLQRTLDWFAIGSELGARFVRVNAISAIEDDDALVPQRATIDSLTRLLDAAGHLGMGLLLENKGGHYDYVDRMLDLVYKVDGLGVILDTGNFEPLVTAMNSRLLGVESGITDFELERVYEQIGQLAPVATVVHVKSHEFAADGTPGPVDLERALAILQRAGFRGPLSIEYEGVAGDPWLGTARTLDAARSILLPDPTELETP